MNSQSKKQAAIASETIKQMSLRKLVPTPENYAKIYAEISGVPIASNGAVHVLRNIAEHLLLSDNSAAVGMAIKKTLRNDNWDLCFSEMKKVLPKIDQESATQTWSALIGILLRQLEIQHKGITASRKKEGLDAVLARFSSKPEVLFEKLSNLIRSWSESPLSDSLVDDESPAGKDIQSPETVVTVQPTVERPTADATIQDDNNEAKSIRKFAGLLALALESGIAAQPELADEIRSLIYKVKEVISIEQLVRLESSLQQLCFKIELRGGEKVKVQEGLLRLLRLLVENVGGMVEDEEWLHGQINTLREIIENPIDKHVIADAERGLREVIIKQGLLKHGLSDTKTTLQNLMSTFIDQLGSITVSTGDYHKKIEGYGQKIAKSTNIKDLGLLLDDIMQDTRVIQTNAMRSHEDLLDSRRQVESAEAKIAVLEKELTEVSELVYQDQLTGALNRHGMNETFDRESKRVIRNQSTLCVALLDIDNFKRLNDTMGHQIGDQALVHLCAVIKESLRPSDSVARYGGEEFIIIMPDVALVESVAAIERLQRELTKKFFMNGNDRILVTFSAGVAQCAENEPQEEVIGRADKAMYQAKKTGKNRVLSSL
jgi:diguanylate cyclase